MIGVKKRPSPESLVQKLQSRISLRGNMLAELEFLCQQHPALARAIRAEHILPYAKDQKLDRDVMKALNHYGC